MKYEGLSEIEINTDLLLDGDLSKEEFLSFIESCLDDRYFEILENVGQRINSGGTFNPPWDATMVIDDEVEKFLDE
jgi:hypothetical protein